jgi:hypothetical protein
LHKLKNRIITFRVTDDEMARLKVASNYHDAKCLSDFVRTVMLGIASDPSSNGTAETPHQTGFESLYTRLAAVESDLSHVIEMLSLAKQLEMKQE